MAVLRSTSISWRHPSHGNPSLTEQELGQRGGKRRARRQGPQPVALYRKSDRRSRLRCRACPGPQHIPQLDDERALGEAGADDASGLFGNSRNGQDRERHGVPPWSSVSRLMVSCGSPYRQSRPFCPLLCKFATSANCDANWGEQRRMRAAVREPDIGNDAYWHTMANTGGQIRTSFFLVETCRNTWKCRNTGHMRALNIERVDTHEDGRAERRSTADHP